MKCNIICNFATEKLRESNAGHHFNQYKDAGEDDFRGKKDIHCHTSET